MSKILAQAIAMVKEGLLKDGQSLISRTKKGTIISVFNRHGEYLKKVVSKPNGNIYTCQIPLSGDMAGRVNYITASTEKGTMSISNKYACGRNYDINVYGLKKNHYDVQIRKDNPLLTSATYRRTGDIYTEEDAKLLVEYMSGKSTAPSLGTLKEVFGA